MKSKSNPFVHERHEKHEKNRRSDEPKALSDAPMSDKALLSRPTSVIGIASPVGAGLPAKAKPIRSVAAPLNSAFAAKAAPTKVFFRGLFFLLLILAAPIQAKTAAPAASNPVAEARLVELSAELRCLVCQNESLASSRAPLAEDLRREVRERIAAGDSNAQIMTHLTDRYGDFVTYRPPFKARTLLLWLLPPVLLIAGLFLLLRRVQRRRVSPQAVDEAALAALRDEFEGSEGKNP